MARYTLDDAQRHITSYGDRGRIVPLYRALRSEWRIDEPARDIVRREMPETRATVREAIRATHPHREERGR